MAKMRMSTKRYNGGASKFSKNNYNNSFIQQNKSKKKFKKKRNHYNPYAAPKLEYKKGDTVFDGYCNTRYFLQADEEVWVSRDSQTSFHSCKMILTEKVNPIIQSNRLIVMRWVEPYPGSPPKFVWENKIIKTKDSRSRFSSDWYEQSTGYTYFTSGDWSITTTRAETVRNTHNDYSRR